MTRPERHQVLSAGSLQAKSGAAFHLWWFSEHILRQDDQWSEAGHKPPNPEIMTQKMSRVNRNGRTKGRLRLKQGTVMKDKRSLWEEGVFQPEGRIRCSRERP